MSARSNNEEKKPASAIYESIKRILPRRLEEKFTFTAPLLYPPTAREIPWRRRIKLYRNGFQPRADYIYNFERYGMDAYLSDRNKHKGDINQPFEDYLKNKRMFYELFDDYGLATNLPELYGELQNGRLPAMDIGITSLLEKEKTLVVKGKTGYGGYNVHVFEFDGQNYYLDNSRVTVESLQNQIQQLDGYLVTEYCTQANYAETLYPKTSNTIRVITVHPEGEKPYIPIAVHRIGTEQSGHVDNCSQGGLTAEIKANGQMRAAGQFVDYNVRWYDRHPNSNAQIKGTTIPKWDEICNEILSIVEQIGPLCYVGWDILVTGPGEFKIIEGNNRSDVDLLQIHQPLLQDKRTRKFFETHGMA